jgi:hypothetical protein
VNGKLSFCIAALCLLALVSSVLAQESQTQQMRLYTSSTQSFPFAINSTETVTISVLGTGIFDGGVGNLTLYENGGTLSFINQNLVNITLSTTVNSSSVLWRLNGATVPCNSTIMLQPLQLINLSWEFGIGEFNIPVLQAIGVFGLIGIIAFPTVTVYKVKKGDWTWIALGPVAVIICVAFVLAWLGG